MLDPQGSHHPKHYLSFRRGQQLILRHPQRGNAEEAWAIFVSSPMHVWDFHFKHSFVTHSIWVGVQLNIHNQNLFFFKKIQEYICEYFTSKDIWLPVHTHLYSPIAKWRNVQERKESKICVETFFSVFFSPTIDKRFYIKPNKIKKTNS